MAEYTRSRVITTVQGPLTVTAVYDSDTYQVVFTVTTANGITATYTDTNQFSGINGRDRFILSQQLAAQGVILTPGEEGNLSRTAARLGSDATKLFRDSLAPAESAAADAQAAAPQGPTASPQQVVKDDGAVTTAPTATQPSTATPTPTLSTGQGDRGTDAPVRTFSQTQTTSGINQQGQAVGIAVPNSREVRINPETGEPYDAAGLPGAATAPTGAGVGSPDDLGATSREKTTQTVNANSSAALPLVTPRPNVLDNFASYTYQISVYICSPEQYNKFVTSGNKSINNYYLLFQSGGAAKNVGGPRGATVAVNGSTKTFYENNGAGSDAADTNNATLPEFNAGSDAGRNPYFPLDFYIDALTLNNVVAVGGSNGSPHQSAGFTMTVIEPNNISFIDRLYEAAQDVAPRDATGRINYAAVQYLMAIRFYGYDINGNLVKGGAGAPGQGAPTDSNAVIEKFIPFRINQIDFTVSNRLATYEIKATCGFQGIAASTRRGTIPFDIELTGGSVFDVLSGSTKFAPATTTSPQNPGATTTADQSAAETARLTRQAAVAAPPTISVLNQGLMQALNDIQQKLVQQGIYSKPDVYKIVFPSSAKAIESARITKPGKKKDLARTPMSQSASQDPRALNPDTQQTSTTQRNISVKAGSQIVQVLDTVIRNSSYITDQAGVVINEDTDLPEPQPSSNNQKMSWYRILMTTKQLEYDVKRNDYAYEIIYTIVPFSLSQMFSPYFPLGKFPGIYKSYPYWFTGQNTSVLDYTAQFNQLYTLTVSGSSPGNNAALETKLKTFQSMRDVPFINYYARSNESSQGSDSKTNELAASAAEYLYTTNEVGKTKLTIVGDPAWIPQGSMSSAPDSATLTGQPFEPDGTINFDAGEVLFEVAWQRPEDYDLNDGLADPFRRTQKTFGDRQPRQSALYTTVSVVSEFKQGKFTQILEGSLYIRPIDNSQNRAPTAAPASVQTTTVPENAQNAAAELALGGYNGGRGSSPVLPSLVNPPSGEVFRGVPVPTTQSSILGGATTGQFASAFGGGTGNGPRTAPPAPVLGDPTSVSPVTGPPTPADTAVPSSPPAAPTSNGGIVGTIGNAVSRLGQAIRNPFSGTPSRQGRPVISRDE